MAKAEAALALAANRRDALATTVDVTILSQWIDRNQAFDTAATTLYKLLTASPHKVTPAIRSAFAGLTVARNNLPPDTKGLEVILDDLARGGLNQAVIEIEDAKGSLINAVALIAGMTAPPATLTGRYTAGATSNPDSRVGLFRPGGSREACSFGSSLTSPGRRPPTSSPCPIVGEPAFDGPLGEINRRAGGELAALATFGELSGKRYHAALAASGDLPAGRLLVVGAGKGEDITRETIHRLGATIERRLGGRTGPLPGDLAGRPRPPRRGRRRDRGRAPRPGRRRGQLRAQGDLPRQRRDAPRRPSTS